MSRALSGALICAFGVMLAGWLAAASAADPLVLFLLRMMRDQAISSAIEAGVAASRQQARPQPPEVPRSAPPPSTEGQWLKGLIEESFLHLSAAQREEVHASLMRILSDPRNAAQRSTILAEFTRQAIAMRDAHRQLSGLSESDMRQIAAEARREYERLPVEQRQQMLEVLRRGVPGMPRALNDLMLAEFASVPVR
ncbi:MAG TPA: hypothetical protein VNK67_03245 [Burkholderiales bacterium]|nr:hypothetical protein [Burkholderiales bacterium]